MSANGVLSDAFGSREVERQTDSPWQECMACDLLSHGRHSLFCFFFSHFSNFPFDFQSIVSTLPPFRTIVTNCRTGCTGRRGQCTFLFLPRTIKWKWKIMFGSISGSHQIIHKAQDTWQEGIASTTPCFLGSGPGSGPSSGSGSSATLTLGVTG